MIEHRNGDIFEQLDIRHIVHQANLYHTFGSGIAAEIKRRYPYAYEADLATTRGEEAKLGGFSVGFGNSTSPNIYNMYSQVGIGGQDRHTSYDAMATALAELEEMLRDSSGILGIPHGIGCGLANGDWRIVEAIIESVFHDSPLRVVICRIVPTF